MIEPPKFHTLARKDYDLRDLEILAQLAMEHHIHSNQQIQEAFQQVADMAGYIEFTASYSKLQSLIMEKRAASLATLQSCPFPFDHPNQHPRPSRASVTHGALNQVVGGRPPTDLFKESKSKHVSLVNKDGKRSLQRASTSIVATDSHGQLHQQHQALAKLKSTNPMKRHSSYVEESSSSMRSWRYRSFRPTNQLTDLASSYRSASIARFAQSQSKLKQETPAAMMASSSDETEFFESALAEASQSIEFVSNSRKITPPKNYSEYEGQMMELLREQSKIDEEIHQKLASTDLKKQRKSQKSANSELTQLSMMHLK